MGTMIIMIGTTASGDQVPIQVGTDGSLVLA